MPSSAFKPPQSWSELLNVNPFLIFGILNVTPDSFSDGGKYSNRTEIENQIKKLISDGANVIDIGAESTRLGAQEVLSSEELSRLSETFEIVNNVANHQVLFSIDTRHSETANIAMKNSFSIINDVSACRFDPQMRNVMFNSDALVVLMHSRSTPTEMKNFTNYENVFDDVCRELEAQVDYVIQAGVDRNKIMIDPGIGFAKTPEDGIILLDRISEFKARFELPVLVGISRKTIISYMISGDPQNVPFEERDELSASMCSILKEAGVDAVRVHNVAQTNKFL